MRTGVVRPIFVTSLFATLLFTPGCASTKGASGSRAPEGQVTAEQGPPEVLAGDVVAGRATAATLAGLRAAGPAGLDALLRAGAPLAEADTPAGRAFGEAVDRVAGQRDAAASGLYWYTDLEEAKKAARATGRPILSLRLLGRLDEELSCANSRFFRVALYANREVARALREGFVLHWGTERPAPVMTIDFGDGRVVRRTVTGNSIHYVLDAEGRPLDALPGLYGPAAFLRAIARASDLARATSMLGDEARAVAVKAYHEAALARLRASWPRELEAAGVAPALPPPAPIAAPSPAPNAVFAMPVAVSKAVVEMPLVRAALPGAAPPVDAVPWGDIAARHAGDARLDDASRALVRRKRPRAWEGSPTISAPLDDEGLRRLVTGFERSMAIDTVRNEYTLHATVERWLTDAPSLSLEALNTRVYSTLFLTPKSDPWLGLIPPGVFSAIENDGLVDGAR